MFIHYPSIHIQTFHIIRCDWLSISWRDLDRLFTWQVSASVNFGPPNTYAQTHDHDNMWTAGWRACDIWKHMHNVCHYLCSDKQSRKKIVLYRPVSLCSLVSSTRNEIKHLASTLLLLLLFLLLQSFITVIVITSTNLALGLFWLHGFKVFHLFIGYTWHRLTSVSNWQCIFRVCLRSIFLNVLAYSFRVSFITVPIYFIPVL
jgi:hypothetical protein